MRMGFAKQKLSALVNDYKKVISIFECKNGNKTRIEMLAAVRSVSLTRIFTATNTLQKASTAFHLLRSVSSSASSFSASRFQIRSMADSSHAPFKKVQIHRDNTVSFLLSFKFIQIDSFWSFQFLFSFLPPLLGCFG